MEIPVELCLDTQPEEPTPITVRKQIAMLRELGSPELAEWAWAVELELMWRECS